MSTSLAERYRTVRAQSLALAEGLSPEDCTVQSMTEASPIKWHLAHTTWFFETFLLEPRASDLRPFHPRFRVLFNSYYNTVGEQHPRGERGLVTRPGLQEILEYRSWCDERVGRLVAYGLDEEGQGILEVGLQHEQQHQELMLTDLKHLLSCNPLRPAYRPSRERDDGPIRPLGFRPFEEGLAEVGFSGEGFAFDNERPRHRVYLGGFELADRLVSCGEYLEFMDEAGYDRPELWLSEGFELARRQGWRAPLYWEEQGRRWWQFRLDGLGPLREDEPVAHLSYYEADAYARWAGARLPTEFEWERAAAREPAEGNFVENGQLHPAPCPSGGGLGQLFGDLWEWTASAYAPYPGYRPPAGALGEYNGKFMVSQMVLRGGSCATPRSHIRSSYRNFFHPPARWQFSGFRLARDLGQERVDG